MWNMELDPGFLKNCGMGWCLFVNLKAVLWIRIRMDPELCLDLEELKFRIQQKVKEHINKTVNSGLFVLLDSIIE